MDSPFAIKIPFRHYVRYEASTMTGMLVVVSGARGVSYRRSIHRFFFLLLLERLLVSIIVLQLHKDELGENEYVTYHILIKTIFFSKRTCATGGHKMECKKFYCSRDSALIFLNYC